MHNCSLHKLTQAASPDDSKILKYRFSSDNLSQLSDLRLKSLYDKKPDYTAISQQPWKSSPKYFKNVLISSLALVKMSMHAKSGGSIEVMGMLTGKIIGTSIIVMDVYSLPVEGTETRVNAQNEAYEYMVQYLDLLKSVGREEHIVGWYHSHPGYGCWLSGIDVATQSLNQNFQDPYLAIVVDPVQSSNQGKIEIGAFRTLPLDYEAKDLSKSKTVNIKSKEKMRDFGIHADQYYALDIELFKSKNDEDVISMILNKSWAADLFHTQNALQEYDRRLVSRVEQLLGDLSFTQDAKYSRTNYFFNVAFERMMLNGSQGPKIRNIDHKIRVWFPQQNDGGESDEDVVGESVKGGDGDRDEYDDDDDDDDDEDQGEDYDDDDEQDSKVASDEQEGECDDEESQAMETDATGNQSFDEASGQAGLANAKKRLHNSEESRASVSRENDRSQLRKRLATGGADSKLGSELKAKTQRAHLKSREKEKSVAGVGHAELLQMLMKRAQRNVFG